MVSLNLFVSLGCFGPQMMPGVTSGEAAINCFSSLEGILIFGPHLLLLVASCPLTCLSHASLDVVGLMEPFFNKCFKKHKNGDV